MKKSDYNEVSKQKLRNNLLLRKQAIKQASVGDYRLLVKKKPNQEV